MNIDRIIEMASKPSTIAALEACKGDNPYKWRKAWFEACKDIAVPIVAISWLNDLARKEGGHKDTV